MSPKTRSNSKRTPVWDSCLWLLKNYKYHNGLPGFFFEGGYSFDMREFAEEDYKYSVDQAAQSSDKAFREWAENIQLNKYSPLKLIVPREYWKSLVEEEVRQKKMISLYEILLTKDEPDKKRRKRNPYKSNDSKESDHESRSDSDNNDSGDEELLSLLEMKRKKLEKAQKVQKFKQ